MDGVNLFQVPIGNSGQENTLCNEQCQKSHYAFCHRKINQRNGKEYDKKEDHV
jgi:hypothetical protein